LAYVLVTKGDIGSISFDDAELIRDVYLDSISDHAGFIQQVEIIEQRKTRLRARVEDAKTESD
jgi:hypothetical protein